MADEAAFVERLRQGDEAAAERLVHLYRGRLLAVARRYHPDADAQDVVQDTFLSAFRALDRFRGEARLSTWLHRIAINQALMKLRSRTRRPETSIDGILTGIDPEALGWMLADATPSAEDVMVLASLRRQLRASIRGLPALYRSVLLLHDIQGLDSDEAARVLAVTPAAVKTRLHRARRALRTLVMAADRRRGAGQPSSSSVTGPKTSTGNRIGTSSRAN